MNAVIVRRQMFFELVYLFHTVQNLVINLIFLFYRKKLTCLDSLLKILEISVSLHMWIMAKVL